MNQGKNTDKNINLDNDGKVKKNTPDNVDDDQNQESFSHDKENHSHENAEVMDDNKTEIKDEVKDLKDQLLRSLAENENLRKRTAKEIEQVKKYGHIGILRDFLTVADNLDRALNSSTLEDQSGSNMKNLVDGIEIVLKEMNSILDKNQIKKIVPLHEKFDYNFHQAMFEAPSQEFDEGLILEVIQPGYILHDRLIRPAMVGVSKGQTQKKEKNEEKNE